MKNRLTQCLIGATLALSVAYSGAAEESERGDPTDARRYDVSLSGFPVGRVTYEYWQQGSDYQVQAFMGSSGFFGAFISTKYSGASVGKWRRGVPQPSAFRGRFQQGRKFADVDVRYSGNRPTKVERFPEADPPPQAVLPKDVRDALDPISALYFMMRDRKAGALCRQDITIYEGGHTARVVTQESEPPSDETETAVKSCNGLYIRTGGFTEAELEEFPQFAFRMEYVPLSDGETYRLARFVTDTEFGTARAVLRQ